MRWCSTVATGARTAMYTRQSRTICIRRFSVSHGNEGRAGLGCDGRGCSGRQGLRRATTDCHPLVSDARRVLRTTAVREGVPACVECWAGHAEDGLSSDAACRPRGGFDVVGTKERRSGRWGGAFLAASRRRGSLRVRFHSQAMCSREAHLDQLWILWPPRHSLQTEPPTEPAMAGRMRSSLGLPAAIKCGQWKGCGKARADTMRHALPWLMAFRLKKCFFFFFRNRQRRSCSQLRMPGRPPWLLVAGVAERYCQPYHAPAQRAQKKKVF